MAYINGNGGSTACGPRINGRGLAHLKAGAWQKAAQAARVALGEQPLDLSLKQAAATFGVNVTYVATAMRLSPEKRQAIACGKDRTPFIALSAALNSPPMLPAPRSAISDAELANIINVAGIDRVLNVASRVEQNGHAVS